MKFVDQTRVFIRAGAGGNGCVSFRREAYVEFGGPNGGDGGRGGNVVVETLTGLNTLVDFRYQRHFKARKGEHGMGSNCTGKTGEDIVLRVPVGTEIYDEAQDFLIADMNKPDMSITLLEGGEGGLGNTRFKSSTNRAPRRTTPGGEALEQYIVLKLKLMADAGLVGLPNAGKSTFLSVVSAAKPKIADYPFTTIHPQLGDVGFGGNEFVLADIPGLIEGASEGIGLGDRFLGHVERCGVLLHLIDSTEEDILGAYDTIMTELEAYGHGLLDKKMVIGLNKSDAIDKEELLEKKAELERHTGKEIFTLSGVAKQGVDDVLKSLWDVVSVDIENRKLELEAESTDESQAHFEDDETSGWSPV